MEEIKISAAAMAVGFKAVEWDNSKPETLEMVRLVAGYAQEAINHECEVLRLENQSYQAAKERVHKSFGFVPHPDGSGNCNCAYCRRDFEAVAEHVALMEMELASLQGQAGRVKELEARRTVVDEQAERQAFEKWITAPPFECSVERFPYDPEKAAWPGHYRDYCVCLAWEAWSEARRICSETLHP